MSLFSNPDEHAANGPDTWRVEKVRDGLWAILTANGERLETYPTRKRAVEGLEDGWAAKLWEKERRWYAGEHIHDWKTFAECKAEQERIARWVAERKAPRGGERMTGYTSGKFSHDPKPYRNRYDGSRWADDGTPHGIADPDLLPYAPRPEFDRHNPILRFFREEVARFGNPAHGDFVYWLEPFEKPGRMTLYGQQLTAEQIAHARRVLTKLAALATTPNGVTD